MSGPSRRRDRVPERGSEGLGDFVGSAFPNRVLPCMKDERQIIAGTGYDVDFEGEVVSVSRDIKDPGSAEAYQFRRSSAVRNDHRPSRSQCYEHWANQMISIIGKNECIDRFDKFGRLGRLGVCHVARKHGGKAIRWNGKPDTEKVRVGAGRNCLQNEPQHVFRAVRIVNAKSRV